MAFYNFQVLIEEEFSMCYTFGINYIIYLGVYMWRHLFAEQILKRGLSIDRKNILNIKIEKDITAKVLGSQEYNLFISGDFSNMECSCPCDGFYCKHLVALFSYLKDKQKRVFSNFWGSELCNKAFDIQVKKEAARSFDGKIKLYDKEFDRIKKENEKLKLELNKSIEKNNSLKTKIDNLKLKNDDLKSQISDLKLDIDGLKFSLNISKSNEASLNYKLKQYTQNDNTGKLIESFNNKNERSKESGISRVREKTPEEIEEQRQLALDRQTKAKLTSKQKKEFDREFSWIDKLNDSYYEYKPVDIGYIDSIYDELEFIREGCIDFKDSVLYGYFYYHMNTETEYFFNPNSDTYYCIK